MKEINFAENCNAFMPSIKMKLALLKGFSNICKYPDRNNKKVNEAVSSYFNISDLNFCVTNGSLAGINIITSLLKIDGGKATIFIPTFWGYQEALEKCEYNYEKVYLDNMFDYNIKKIDEKAKDSSLIILCNPNNPTLSRIDKKDLINLINNNPNCHFVIDETMLIFNNNYLDLTMYQEVVNYHNLSVVLSLSKILSIPGLRAGIVFSNSEMIDKINKTKIPYGNNILLEEVLPTAFSDPKYIEHTKSKIMCNGDELVRNLRVLGYKVITNKTNFILVKINDRNDLDEIINYLTLRGLFVRNTKDSYPELNGNWLRITINSKNNNKKLVKALGVIRYL